MKIKWAPEALRDLAELHAYIAREDPGAADAVVRRILSLVESQLPAMPHLGRPGRVAGTRELVASGTPFIVPYRIRAGQIEIARVYHAARRWPSAFQEPDQE